MDIYFHSTKVGVLSRSPPDNRLTFGDCCSPFVAVYATRKVAEDYSKGREGAADAIRNRLYMDDYLDSADTVEKAVQRAKEVDDILKNGDFHLTK